LNDASSAAAPSVAGSKRSEFDDFQRKWDRFDNDEYLNGLECGGSAETRASAKTKSGKKAASGTKNSSATSKAVCANPFDLVRRVCGRRAK